MARKVFGIFYKSWKLWFHYIPLTLFLTAMVFVAHYLSGKMEQLAIAFPIIGYPILFIWYFLWLLIPGAIVDQIIHAIIGED